MRMKNKFLLKYKSLLTLEGSIRLPWIPHWENQVWIQDFAKWYAPGSEAKSYPRSEFELFWACLGYGTRNCEHDPWVHFLTNTNTKQFSTSQNRKRLPQSAWSDYFNYTTATTHNEGIILQSNQSNSTEQKKTIHVVYSLLSMVG